MITKRWQDQVNALLGLWLIVSPWVLDYTGTRMLTLGMPTAAVWTALLFGLAAVVLSFLDMYAHKVWEMAVDFLVGFALLIAPTLLGFSSQAVPTLNDRIVGAALMAIALTTLIREPEIRGWFSSHRPAH